MFKTLVVVTLMAVAGGVFYMFYLAPERINVSFGTVTIGQKDFKVEIADTLEKQNLGLSYRDDIGSASGMLFVFPAPAQYEFTMRGMRFGLDFLWIKDGRVIDLSADVLPPKLGDEPVILRPASEVNYVLEVPAGFIRNYLIENGTFVNIALPRE